MRISNLAWKIKKIFATFAVNNCVQPQSRQERRVQYLIYKKLFLELGITALAAGEAVLMFTEENSRSASGARGLDSFRLTAAYVIKFIHCH